MDIIYDLIMPNVTVCHWLFVLGEPPEVTDHPERLNNVSPETSVTFTIQTSVMEPLSYQWKRKPPGEADDWQPCDVEGSNKATLTIPTASDKRQFRCIIYNHGTVGRKNSKQAKLQVSWSAMLIVKELWTLLVVWLHICSEICFSFSF